MPLVLATLCLASTPVPFNVECEVLDRVAQAANARPGTGQVALEVLQRVAEGRADSISAESESQLGLKPHVLQQAEFKDATVRAHALRKIGEIDLPETLQYLRSLKPDRLPPDDTQQVWLAAQIARHEALLNRIPDLQKKIEFLENTLKERHDAVSNSAVVSWSVDELCNRGILTSLPAIQASISRRGISGQDAEDEIQFCEARIRAVSDPDRAKAIGSVLTLENGSLNPRLVYWAINQLASMHSGKADAELDRYAAEIRRLPEGSSQKEQLSGFGQTIRELRPQR